MTVHLYSVYTVVYDVLSIPQGMFHHIRTTITMRTPTSFLLVLLINQHTINHHTMATFHQDTMFGTMDTHHLPSSHQLTVHIIPASNHTSTLDLMCKDQVTKVRFVVLFP